MKKYKLTIALSIAALILAGCSGGNTAAGSGNAAESGSSSYPDKSISFVVPWSAGGSSDATVRAMADLVNAHYGVPTSVVNRDGAGGTIATTEFMSAKADGYNICWEAIGVFTTQPYMREVKYSIDDFKVVIGLTSEPIVMVANKDSGITSVAELMAAGRSVNYGFSGTGSLMELAQKKFVADAGIDADGVPFEGSSQVITALLGGHIDVGAAHPGELKQYFETGDLIPIGIFSQERDTRESFKDIPTFKEQGYDIDMSVWKFFIVPKDTPDEIVTELYETMAELAQHEKFVEFCNNSDLMIEVLSPSEATAKIKAEAEINKALFE